jgi:acylphosphatase
VSERVHAFVAGRVQGVWFRGSTRAEAKRLGLTGWVRNLLDGRVELVAEGPEERVEALVAWCRHGPPHARVDDLEVIREAATGEFPDFLVTG